VWDLGPRESEPAGEDADDRIPPVLGG
jgi:hypothetical protein